MHLAHRCCAILLSADGWRVGKVAKLLHANDATAHRWLDRFEGGGVQGLVIGWGSGRPPTWHETYESLLVETVRHDPLPGYAPKHSLQGYLWQWLRHEVTHSHFVGSLAALAAAARRFFAKLAKQPEKVLQRVGMAASPLDRHLADLMPVTSGGPAQGP